MPAAPAIAPLLGAIAVKTTFAPAAPATGDAFGEVFRAVWGTASGVVAVPAPDNGAQGPPAQADPDLAAAAIVEATADQVTTAPPILADRPVAARDAALAEKTRHPGKDDSEGAITRATVPREADPTAAAPSPSIMPAAAVVAAPAGVPRQLTVPPAVTVHLGTMPGPANNTLAIPAQGAASAEAAPLTMDVGISPRGASPARAVVATKGSEIDGTPPPGAVPAEATVPAQAAASPQDAASRQAAASPQAAVPADRLDTGGIPSPGAEPSRTAAPPKGPDIKGRPPQAALSVPAASAQEAEPAAPAVSIQAPAYPAGGTTGTEPLHAAAPDPSASSAANSLAGREGVSPNGKAPSLQPHETTGPGGQPAPAIAAPGTPSQPERAASGSSSQQTTPAPALPPPIAATEIAGSAAPAPATDHKITLRPVEAGPDPAPSVSPSDALLEQAVPTGTPAAVSATSSVTATPQTHPASPAEQVAPALLTLAKTLGGGQQMTVRLQPADLGMVQVRIAQAASGTTQIDITAENPATLLALQRDQPQLHRTLDEAGIPAAGRTVTFHIAQAAQAAASNGPGAGHAGSQQGSANRSSSGATDADGSAAGGRGSYRASERNTYPTARRPAAPPATPGPPAATAAQSYRIGLDITA